MQMVNKQMKRCSTSQIIRGMQIQIKTTVRFYISLVRMPIKKKKKTMNTSWQRCRKKQIHIQWCWECKLGSSMEIFQETINKTTLRLATPLLGVHLTNRTPVFIAVLLTIAKVHNPHKCPSRGQWIKKKCTHIHTHKQIKWNTTQTWRRMKFCHLWQHGWT